MAFTDQVHVDHGGQHLAIRVHRAPVPGAPALVFWPAMGVPAGYYDRFAGQLVERGLTVLVPDLRGTGDSTPVADRSARYGYRELVGDVRAALAAVHDELAGRPVLLGGHSLGGQVATLHLAERDPHAVAGLVLVAVGVPYWRLYPGRRRLAVLAMTQGIDAVSRVRGYWPGWSFGGVQARGVIRDWAHTARHGRYPWRGAAAVDLSRVEVPVLAVSVADDQLTPAPTVDHLTAMLGSSRVNRHHYEVAEAGAPLDHLRWARAAGPLAARVAAFAREVS